MGYLPALNPFTQDGQAPHNQRITNAATPPSVRSGRLMPKGRRGTRCTRSILPGGSAKPVRGSLLYHTPSEGIDPESVNGLGPDPKSLPLPTELQSLSDLHQGLTRA